MQPDSFTIRIYGLLIHQEQVLLSRENIQGDIYTKFPGGGLELGEGVVDCLRREFMEEVQITLSDWELFHINENFLASAFHRSRQVISIYYKVWTNQTNEIIISDPKDSFRLQSDGDQLLYWSPLSDLIHQPIQLPIDQEVVQKLVQEKH